jgi:anti-sigma regulatory factor (Ser/Thr protein kinase)
MGAREEVSFVLTADPRAAFEARHRALQAAGRCLRRKECMETLGLLVSELVTNAVLHGGAGAELELTISLADDLLRVEVLDSGPGFVPRPRALAPDDVGGWGLYLVERLARTWGVSSGDGTRVWFELPCERAQTPRRKPDKARSDGIAA